MRSFRPTLLTSALLACGLGCSPKVSSGALKVEVVYDASVVSKCVKVVATDEAGSPPLETMPILLANQTSPLLVGVGGSSPLVQPFRVQALGYSDEGCTMRSNEESTAEPGVFAVPPQTVTLVLKAQPRNDGGTDGGSTDGGTDDGGAPDAGESDGGSTDAGLPDAGTDGGAIDAGVDLDQDGWFAGTGPNADCNDNNPMIHPGRPEVCTNNNVDDNCNGKADCSEDSCDAGTCTNMGTCTNGLCITPIEVCNDNVDNNNNSLIDCAEPSCAAQACNDSSDCTTNETCSGADAGCVGTLANLCMSPPVCHSMAGVCQADGGMCTYTPLNSGPCDDMNACTTGDTCASGMCTGTTTPCPDNNTNVCLSMAGACERASGMCRYTPLITGPCSDNDNCTLNDTCDGDGGCRSGTPANCTEPSPCHRWDNTCQSNGTCNFVPRATCDAGMGAPGTCNPGFQCIPAPANVFPYTPSTFTEAQLPAAAGPGLTVSCNTVINTGGTPAVVDGGCVTLPPFAVLPAVAGGQETLLLKVSALTVNSSQTLTFIGPRPVVFAVLGNATIDGTILANSGQAPSSLCGTGGTGTVKEGGGGGGFGRDGGAGGQSDNGVFGAGGAQNGALSLDPLRGGCPGGSSDGASGGNGGGGLQISAVNTITVAGTIAASGFGGGGSTSSNAGGGGGGSGGAILLEGAMVTTSSSAIFTANGGGGGGGEDSGNGATGTAGATNTSTPAPGGNGPSNAGNGGAGGAGTTNAANGQNSTNDGAGGGGGAVGRIRLRGSSCTVDGATLFSPPRAGGC